MILTFFPSNKSRFGVVFIFIVLVVIKHNGLLFYINIIRKNMLDLFLGLISSSPPSLIYRFFNMLLMGMIRSELCLSLCERGYYDSW